MWTANIDTIGKNGSDVKIQVTYSNIEDNEQIRESYSFSSPDQLKSTIISKIDQLQNRDDGIKDIAVGPVEIPEIKPPVIIPPDQQLLDFIKDLGLIKQIQKSFTLGLKTDKDADYLALLTKLKTEFKIDYLSYV